MKGLLAVLLVVGLWVGWAEAKNCTGPDCVCGDTLVANYTIPPLPPGQYHDCSKTNVNQGLTLANYVVLNCSGNQVVGNKKAASAAFRLGYKSQLVNCWGQYWHQWTKVDSWEGAVIGGGGFNLLDECLHLSDNSGYNYISGVTCYAPKEALYLLHTHHNWIEYSYFNGGSNAVYIHEGSHDNWVVRSSLRGGSNRVNLETAGANNFLDNNDYAGGNIRSLGSVHPNYYGPVPVNAVIHSFDGSLVPY